MAARQKLGATAQKLAALGTPLGVGIYRLRGEISKLMRGIYQLKGDNIS